MTLTRAAILVKRYLAIAIVGALVGSVGAYGAAMLWNRGLKPRWEGTASILVQVEFSGQTPTEAELTAAVLAAKEIAAIANEADLRRRDASITVNSSDGTMSFVAEGRSNEEAKRRASDMRMRYVEAASAAADLAPKLEAQFAEAKRLQNEILRIQAESASVPYAPADFMTSLEVEISMLSTQIDAFEKESVALTVQKLLSDDDEEIAELTGQITLLVNQSTALRTELAERIETFEFLGGQVVDPEPTSAGPAEVGEPGEVDIPVDPISKDDWLIDALIARYTSLQEQYSEGLGSTLGPVTLPPVVAANISLPKVSPLTAAAVGGLSVLVAFAGIILIRDLTRKPLWSEHDLEGISAITIPDRRRSHRSRWQPIQRRKTAAVDRRRTGLLLLNRLVATAIDRQHKVVAVSAVGTHTRATPELAMDLALGLARAEWGVALLDAATASELESSTNPTRVRQLGDFMMAVKESRVGLAEMLMKESPRLAEGVTYIVTGDLPPEKLASAAAGDAIELLRSFFDIVLVLTDPIGEPVADSLIARCDALIPVTVRGVTPRAELLQVRDQAARDGVGLLAVVLGTRQVQRWRSHWSRWVTMNRGAASAEAETNGIDERGPIDA